jgi:hypothetical protein
MNEQFERAEMHPLAEGIAHFQQSDDLVGESLDHGDFAPQAKIPDFGAKRFAFVEQRPGAYREGMQALQQSRR